MTSPIDSVGAVRRALTTVTRDGQELRRVVATRDYPTTPDDLWDALTDPERLPRWFLPVTGDLRVGGRYQLEGNAGGEVLACEPPRVLRVSWEFGTQTSWVTVTLAPADDGTRLELAHEVPVDDHWRDYGPGAVGLGWELGLRGLAEHVATSAQVDPAAAAAWMASADGTSYLRAGSAAWAQARIAAGDDPAEAEAAAARCTAAYTGEA
jgi:uncharacterized protein YndB with AHSA1/START domain